MRQKLIGILSAVSIALFGAVVTLFVLLDHGNPLEFERIPLHVRNATLTITLDPIRYEVSLNTPLPKPPIGPADEPRFMRMEGLGLLLCRNVPDIDVQRGDQKLIGYRTYLSLPPWHLLVIASILPLRTALLSWRRRRRERKKEAGLCIHCGYDLRASTGRCPECGAEIEAQTQVAKA